MEQIFIWPAPLEIFLLAALFYVVFAFLQGTRGAGILRGLGAVLGILLIILLSLAESLHLYVLNSLITSMFGFLVFALIVIFQPELRSALVRVGQSPVFTRFARERWNVSNQILKAVLTLAGTRTGAIIALQRSVGLRTYTDKGIRLDAEVSRELLISIFQKHAPLHDGAVVIKAGRIIAAACIFPLSENPNIDSALGTRHRAAIGITEESDAVSIVVSEETGDVSVAQNGLLTRRVDEDALRTILHTVSSEEGFQTTPIEDLG